MGLAGCGCECDGLFQSQRGKQRCQFATIFVVSARSTTRGQSSPSISGSKVNPRRLVFRVAITRVAVRGHLPERLFRSGAIRAPARAAPTGRPATCRSAARRGRDEGSPAPARAARPPGALRFLNVYNHLRRQATQSWGSKIRFPATGVWVFNSRPRRHYLPES